MSHDSNVCQEEKTTAHASTGETSPAPDTSTEPETADSSASSHHEEPPPSPPPPGGPSTLSIAMFVLIGVSMLAAGVYWGDSLRSGIARIRQASLGDEQTKMEGMEGMADADHEDGAIKQFYTCGMHPWVVLPEPGPCPICGMQLTPIDPDKFTGEIAIDPVVTQNMGVRIRPVTTGPLVKTIRTVGTIDYDETRVRDINIKAPGWIEKLYVDYIGAPVKKGDPLLDLYSPELYSAQEELLLAHRYAKVDAMTSAEENLPKDSMLQSARTRLEYYDVSPEQIQSVLDAGKPEKTMRMISPYPGIVIEKHANEGMRVDQGMRVYRIADLSTVWVMVALYEYQLPYVQVGQEAVMSLSYIPGETFEGKVIYIYPYLDPKTRQVNVRLEFKNPHMILKPGMFASVELHNTLAQERTLAPRSAIIDTGERQIAFVSLGKGRFEPRNVLMGIETQGGLVEILDGLKPGEQVVTSGQFLLDSEARIREGLAKMIKGNLASEQKPVVAKAAPIANAGEAPVLPAEAKSALAALTKAYITIGDLLATDSSKGVKAPAKEIVDAVDGLLKTPIPGSPQFWSQHDELLTVQSKAKELDGIADLKGARLRYADMSVALAKLLKATGAPPSLGAEVQEMHCPMFQGGQGGSIWLQLAGDVRNPFLGTKMIECFDRQVALPPMVDEVWTKDEIRKPAGSEITP